MYVRVTLDLGMRQFRALIDAETNIWIRRASADLAALQASRTLDGNLQDTDGGVERLARKHLLDIQRKEVRVVHHWAEDRVDHVADESRQSRNLHIKN